MAPTTKIKYPNIMAITMLITPIAKALTATRVDHLRKSQLMSISGMAIGTAILLTQLQTDSSRLPIIPIFPTNNPIQ